MMDYKNYKSWTPKTLGAEKAQLVLKNAFVVNVFSNEITKNDVAVEDGCIVGVGEYSGRREIDLAGKYICPGFIDAHVHLESALASPAAVVTAALRRGTTTFIADPHEAANVAGEAGIDYILDSTSALPANVYIMLPSCVPSGKEEENGCTFDAEKMKKYVQNPRVLGLGEVMDYPAVLGGDPGMMDKLGLFSRHKIDGHAPGLSQKELQAYAMAGIKTDHECVDFAYALEEIRCGMHVIIREGSGARNLEALVTGLVESGCDRRHFSFGTDDKHIRDIETEGHIDHNIRKSIRLGLSPVEAIKIATINTAEVYGLSGLGAVAAGYRADLVVLNDLEAVEIHAVYHGGVNVSEAHIKLTPAPGVLKSTINIADILPGALALKLHATEKPHVIEIVPGQLLTKHLREEIPSANGYFTPNSTYNKAVTVERYRATGHTGIAPVKGFNLAGGALGSSFSHDSHNLIAVGDSDEAIMRVLSALKEAGGGYAVCRRGEVRVLPLPVMGLISEAEPDEIEAALHEMLDIAHALGVPPDVNPFISLSFLALPVIPELRVTTKGIFDVTEQTIIKSPPQAD